MWNKASTYPVLKIFTTPINKNEYTYSKLLQKPISR